MLAAFWLRCTGETLRQQLSVLLHCLLLQLALFLSSRGAPRGEIWREVQQEGVRQQRVKANSERDSQSGPPGNGQRVFYTSDSQKTSSFLTCQCPSAWEPFQVTTGGFFFLRVLHRHHAPQLFLHMLRLICSPHVASSPPALVIAVALRYHRFKSLSCPHSPCFPCPLFFYPRGSVLILSLPNTPTHLTKKVQEKVFTL